MCDGLDMFGGHFDLPLVYQEPKEVSRLDLERTLLYVQPQPTPSHQLERLSQVP